MVITHHGGQCFKVSHGDLTLAFNPPGKDSAHKGVKFGSDITLISLNHPDFNGVENTSFGDRLPFVIEGPGEYEVKGVAVRGFAIESSYKHPDASVGARTLVNTIYSVSLEGMNLCFLGALPKPELPPAAKQELDDIDILFLPVGGAGVLDYEGAEALAVQLEPKAIIPMHYGPEQLKKFLKEAGAEGTKSIDKFTVKRKDLEGKEGEIIVLEA